VHSQALELEGRAGRFAADTERLLNKIPDAATAHKLSQAIKTSSVAMHAGYRDACASSSPEQFISRISAVARNAKKTKAGLVLLVQLNHLDIDIARATILEARALEAIFTASRNTAKRRQRGRLVSRRNPSERAARGRRKTGPEAPGSAWGDVVGPQASADKSPQAGFPAREAGFWSGTSLAAGAGRGVPSS
jgi:hypothetical protein